MKQFSILNKQTELLAPTAFAWGEVRYFIDDELNVWQVFKGDGETVIEKNPDLYVQFDNTTQDINRLQKLKADHYNIESGTHGFSRDGSVAKDGIKPPPVFTGTYSPIVDDLRVPPSGDVLSGIGLIAKERTEQIEKHGRTVESDVKVNYRAELHDAAIFALSLDENYYPMSWADEFKQRLLSKRGGSIERLKIAGALCAAEIDRLILKNQTDGTSDAG